MGGSETFAAILGLVARAEKMEEQHAGEDVGLIASAFLAMNTLSEQQSDEIEALRRELAEAREIIEFPGARLVPRAEWAEHRARERRWLERNKA